MLPEKRRMGRAIRKARREAGEQDVIELFDQIVAAWAQVVDAAADVLEVVGRAFLALAEALRTPPTMNAIAPMPSLGVRELSGPRTGDPSQSGGQALRSSPGAFDDDEPFEGIGTY